MRELILGFATMCFLISSCVSSRNVTSKKEIYPFTKDIEVIVQFLKIKGWGFYPNERLYDLRVFDRSMTGYMYVSLDFSEQYNKDYDSPIPLPVEVEINYNYLVEKMRDSIQIPYQSNSIDLPFDLTRDRYLIDNTWTFSPQLRTTKEDIFVVVCERRRMQDSVWYIFVLKHTTLGFEVLDYIWDDGPVLHIPIEEDLLEQEYQRLYGQGGSK